jgi:hypothetical protein
MRDLLDRVDRLNQVDRVGAEGVKEVDPARYISLLLKAKAIDI